MAPLIASSGRLRFQKVSLLSKVEGSPPLFRFQRDIASSLPAFLFLPSSKKYPPSFLPFLSRLVGKKNVARSNEESFFFFSFVYAVEFASVRRLFEQGKIYPRLTKTIRRLTRSVSQSVECWKILSASE